MTRKSTKVAKKMPAKRSAAKTLRRAAPKPTEQPKLLSGGNPQIAKGYGDAPVQAYIAEMPGWKRDVGARLDAIITRAVPGVKKAVKWNSPFYGVEDGVLVPQFSCLHEVCESNVPERRVAASAASRAIQTQRRALPRCP